MNQIQYDATNHTYSINGKPLESVTKFIKQFAPPFDKAKVSAYVAKRDGLTVTEVLAQWEAKGKASRDRGTLVHSYIESELMGRNDQLSMMVNTKLPEIVAFESALKQLRESANMKISEMEIVTGDEELGIAGRLDLEVILTLNGQEFYSLLDWKTGKLDTENKFENLLPPFSRFPNCALYNYSLQLSLYRLLREREHSERKYGNGYLVHLKEDGTFQLHPVVDLREELLRFIKNPPKKFHLSK